MKIVSTTVYHHPFGYPYSAFAWPLVAESWLSGLSGAIALEPIAACEACGAYTRPHPDGTVCRDCFTAELSRHHVPVCDYTVVIPPAIGKPTIWHGNARGSAREDWTLTRGSFATLDAAHRWAEAHIFGHAYTVRWRDAWSGATVEHPGDVRVMAPGLWALAWIGRAVRDLAWWGVLPEVG